jgi:hypothetical protein
MACHDSVQAPLSVGWQRHIQGGDKPQLLNTPPRLPKPMRPARLGLEGLWVRRVVAQAPAVKGRAADFEPPARGSDALPISFMPLEDAKAPAVPGLSHMSDAKWCRTSGTHVKDDRQLGGLRAYDWAKSSAPRFPFSYCADPQMAASVLFDREEHAPVPVFARSSCSSASRWFRSSSALLATRG